jgi:hypothetical protein
LSKKKKKKKKKLGLRFADNSHGGLVGDEARTTPSAMHMNNPSPDL